MSICITLGMLFSLELACGCSSAVEPKILNGQPVRNMKEYGYSVFFVSVGFEQITCGGSIINQRTVLTAAHCIHDAPRHRGFFIRVGSYIKEQGTPYRVKYTVVHEKYDPTEVTYDIGLAAVDRDIQFGSYVYRVALSRKPAQAGLVGTVAGWGISKEGLIQDSNNLLYAKQKILPLYRCREIMKIEVRPKTFCAGERYARRYPSRGDSGGALVLEGNLQVGILSSQVTVGVALYTDVSQFLNWIESHTKRLLCQ